MSCVVPKCSWNAADVEVGERARPREPVDVVGFEPGVGDRALGRLGADLARGATRRLRVRGLADARRSRPAPRTSSRSVACPQSPRPRMLSVLDLTGSEDGRATCRPRMPMPTDIGVIDLMIGSPSAIADSARTTSCAPTCATASRSRTSSSPRSTCSRTCRSSRRVDDPVQVAARADGQVRHRAGR